MYPVLETALVFQVAESASVSEVTIEQSLRAQTFNVLVSKVSLFIYAYNFSMRFFTFSSSK